MLSYDNVIFWKSHIRDLILDISTYVLWRKKEAMWEVCKVNGWEENKEGVEEEESEWVKKIERITGGKRCKETAVLCWVNGISFGKKFITDFTLFFLQIEVRWNSSVLDHLAHFFLYVRMYAVNYHRMRYDEFIIAKKCNETLLITDEVGSLNT